MNRRTTLILTVMTFAMLPQAGFAQSNPLSPWVGAWKTNIAKSTYNPGPPPKSQSSTIEVQGQTLTLTNEGVNARGNPIHNVLTTIDDGKPHPVKAGLPYDAESSKVVSDSTAWLIRTKDGKVVQTLISVVSPDRKTWTVTFVGTPNGQPQYNVVVREKQ